MGNSLRFSRILSRLIVSLVLVIGAIGESGPALAWGDLGHKIVCQIAFQELNDKARTEVVRLIALDQAFDSFTDACTWPDHPRRRAEEHFINVPRTLQTIATAQCQGTRDLLDGLPQSDKAAWVAIPIEGWANESFQVTRRKSVGYCVRSGTKCIYQQGNETFTVGEDEKVVVVNTAYLEQHVPFVRDRLKRAGIRLAHLINSTLGQQ